VHDAVLTEYYFDLETYSPEPKPDPVRDKIITIQFQELSTTDGRPRGDLEILTEWGLKSERALLREFRPRFFGQSDFDFVPIGVNLYGYDLICLFHRLNKHFHLKLGIDFLRTKPVIDIKPILVIKNQGEFRNYQRCLGGMNGHLVAHWYQEKEFNKIERYVRNEARNFIEKYQTLKSRIPGIRL